MIFSSPSNHQKIYLLGVCAILILVVTYVAKNGIVHHNDIVYSGSGTASLSTVPVGVSTKNSSSSLSFHNSPTSSSRAASSTVVKKATQPASPLDEISASAYLVGNAATGQIYLSKNPTLVNGIASISKLFTAIVAQQDMDPNQTIQITPAMLSVYPNSYGILLGEKFTLSDLLYAMLLQSNDNIAEGIAMAYSSPVTYISAPSGTTPSESAFIEKMNVLASSLGLTQTHFQDASGLAAGNISDAKDLFTFAQYLYHSQQNLLSITQTYSYTVATSSEHLGHDFINIDPFVGDPHYAGGKTGRTDLAGETMLSIFNYESNGVNYPIVVIVLHSSMLERQNDSSELYLQAINLINKKSLSVN